jgi:hypothetical protein
MEAIVNSLAVIAVIGLAILVVVLVGLIGINEKLERLLNDKEDE